MNINLTLLLVAIAQVESGGNDAAIGKAGERSAFQMTRATWDECAHDHGILPGDFERDASNREIADSRATATMIRRMKQLEAAKIPVTVENLALAWHMGVSGAKRAMGPGYINAKDYAQRVANLYADALAHQPNNVPAHLSGVLPPPPKPDSQ